MLKEIRLYYESLEQAENYIKPLIESSLKKQNISIELKFIKLKGNSSYYSKHIAPLIFWKDPDILLTCVTENEEHPFLMIEFSNAVFTEDHELQRFDGLVAGANNNCIYTKISPINKHSQSQHGGNTEFDYVGPFAVIYNKFGKLFYHFDWDCNDKGVVVVDDAYLSCPKNIDSLDFFFDELIKLIAAPKLKLETFISDFEQIVIRNKFFLDWLNKIKNVTMPNIEELNTSRTEWINNSKEFVLKLNRFGHAMDPERGMLAYYGTFYRKTVSKMLFSDVNNAWYKDTPKETKIEEYIASKGLTNGYDFLYCFMLGSGLYNHDDFNKIVASFEKNRSASITVDLTLFLKSNYLGLNKALRTIFNYSNYFVIVDKNNSEKVKLCWSPFDKNETYKGAPDITPISLREIFDEDDVTYIIVHNVLKQNDYKIIAVSYPGAQADRVILIAPGTGRKQERRYIDIISYLPNKYTTLQENKGKFSRAQTQNDIDELKKYKNSDDHKNGILAFIDRFDKSAPKTLKIGVGFWANSRFSVSDLKDLDIKDLDYFVYLTSNRREWHIWNTGNGDMFKTMKGTINIPTTFEIVKPIEKSDLFFSDIILNEDINEKNKYSSHLPVYSLQAVATAFRDCLLYTSPSPRD